MPPDIRIPSASTPSSYCFFLRLLQGTSLLFPSAARAKTAEDEDEDEDDEDEDEDEDEDCLLYTSPRPRDATLSRMPSSA